MAASTAADRPLALCVPQQGIHAAPEGVRQADFLTRAAQGRLHGGVLHVQHGTFITLGAFGVRLGVCRATFPFALSG